MPTRNQRLRNDVEEAYQIQVEAAYHGGARAGAVGLGLATLGHYYWPQFRRQTLAFKGLLVTIVTTFGFVIAAENALLSYEARKRVEESRIRRQAVIDLARRGVVGTEREIEKWRAEREGRTDA